MLWVLIHMVQVSAWTFPLLGDEVAVVVKLHIDAGLCSTLQWPSHPVLFISVNCSGVHRGLNIICITQPPAQAVTKRASRKGPPEGQTSNVGHQFWSPVWMCAWRPVLEAFMHTFWILLFMYWCRHAFPQSPDQSVQRQYWFLSGAESTWSICRWNWAKWLQAQPVTTLHLPCWVYLEIPWMQWIFFFVYVFLMFWM